MPMHYTFDNHIYSFSFMTSYVLLVWQIYFFSMTYANTFEIVHTCVCIQIINAHEVLSDSLKYFTFCEPYLFIHVYDVLNIPHLAVIFFYCHEAFTEILNHSALGGHICSFTLMTTYVFLAW